MKHVKKEVEIRFVRCCSASCYPPSIPPLHSPSLPSLFYPLLFLSLPQIQNMSSFTPSPLCHSTPPVVIHTLFIWSHCACASMADRDIRRQHRQLGRRFSASFPQQSWFSRFFCFFKKRRKWNKNYSLVSFFLSVSEFSRGNGNFVQNSDMKNRGLKSCH